MINEWLACGVMEASVVKVILQYELRLNYKSLGGVGESWVGDGRAGKWASVVFLHVDESFLHGSGLARDVGGTSHTPVEEGQTTDFHEYRGMCVSEN